MVKRDFHRFVFLLKESKKTDNAVHTFLVSYDLRKPGKDYKSLHEHLKSYSNWAKPLESVWLIKSSLTCEQVGNNIYSHMDTNDKLFVLDINDRKAVWSNNLPQDVKDWLSNNI